MIQKKSLYFIAVIILGIFLTGCSLQEEKSYQYYTMHPSELSHDYHYCETHPSDKVCMNIVKKYFTYQRYLKMQNNYKNTTATTRPIVAAPLPKITKGKIFQNLDEPVSAFGS